MNAIDAFLNLFKVVDEIEYQYRHRGLDAIRSDGKESAMFTELWRAADAARQKRRSLKRTRDNYED
jgi:hypothetical protein